jgi:hypothetical protein
VHALFCKNHHGEWSAGVVPCLAVGINVKHDVKFMWAVRVSQIQNDIFIYSMCFLDERSLTHSFTIRSHPVIDSNDSFVMLDFLYATQSTYQIAPCTIWKYNTLLSMQHCEVDSQIERLLSETAILKFKERSTSVPVPKSCVSNKVDSGRAQPFWTTHSRFAVVIAESYMDMGTYMKFTFPYHSRRRC